MFNSVNQFCSLFYLSKQEKYPGGTDVFESNGEVYHIGDFVYIEPRYVSLSFEPFLFITGMLLNAIYKIFPIILIFFKFLQSIGNEFLIKLLYFILHVLFFTVSCFKNDKPCLELVYICE